MKPTGTWIFFIPSYKKTSLMQALSISSSFCDRPLPSRCQLNTSLYPIYFLCLENAFISSCQINMATRMAEFVISIQNRKPVKVCHFQIVQQMSIK